tara:strand:- start:69 stop:890 length:822 start_codon:yes stop_codon:yes gene_type:complete
MDYLNYGKNQTIKDLQKFQEQPQLQPELQGSGQQKVQLTMDDFKFGTLTGHVTEPKVQTNDELVQLFPTPLLICPCPFEYDEEMEWMKKQSYRRENRHQETGASLNRQTDDTFILDKPEMSRVRQFIDSKIKDYTINIMGSDNEMVITQSWLNKNCKGESHHEHKHPNSMISGVWYPKIHEKLPPIQFRTPRQSDLSLSYKQYNQFNSATFMLPMKKGELIIFPSDLMHSVPINHTNEERLSLSFNTWCTGSLGDIKSLTYLPLEGKGLPVIK